MILRSVYAVKDGAIYSITQLRETACKAVSEINNESSSESYLALVGGRVAGGDLD